MKKKFFAIFAVTALLLGMTGCSKSDDEPTIDVEAAEKELVGIWWDEFEYSDVTEDGVPFTRALLAVEADEDHTGCIYLGLFDNNSDEPLAVYGGREDAGFNWKVLENGRIVLSDPITEESYELARVSPALTRADGGSNYSSNMTNVSGTDMNYSNGSITVNNGTYSGTLNKADANTAAEIEKKLSSNVNSNVELESGGDTPNGFNENDIR